jgi:hypothetical protein
VVAWTDRVFLYFFDLVVVILVASGLAAALSSGAREFLRRQVGRIVGAIMAESRTEERHAQAKAQTATALLQALSELSDAMAGGLRGDKPLARIRTLCPEARPSCDALLAAYEDGVTRQRNDFYPMLDAIRDASKDCLG